MTPRDLIPWRKRRRSSESLDTPQWNDIHDMFRDVMEDFFGTDRAVAPWRSQDIDFGPAVDISETEKEYRVDVELPGMEKDNLDVTIDNGRLHITGEKQQEDRDEKKNYVRTERSYGSFSRTLQLPATVNEDEAEADYKDGVLTVRLPKAPDARGKRIDVKTSE